MPPVPHNYVCSITDHLRYLVVPTAFVPLFKKPAISSTGRSVPFLGEKKGREGRLVNKSLDKQKLLPKKFLRKYEAKACRRKNIFKLKTLEEVLRKNSLFTWTGPEQAIFDVMPFYPLVARVRIEN
ncbi:hypothetical cytosolic protein [Syntrophus aciditrophicus SB]|uniref:Hypothetical cytosolic protein n=1 Tax=Syntrophus aciditrophicus (strain SB) TaxID=56780 RepID=Q2LXW9_SYNAS|nr:hypothetical cytosolic protein [Syntrophus aciditrophicus SB]